MKLVITTSSGERSTAWSTAPDDTFSTKTRSTGPDERVRQRHVVDDAAVDEAAAVVVHDREHARERGAREQRGLQRPAREHDLLAGVEVGGDHAQRDLEVGERTGRRAVVDERVEALAAEQVRAPAHDVPRPVDLAAGEHVVGCELLPHRGELRDAGEVRRVSRSRRR